MKVLKLSSSPIKTCGACPTIFEFEIEDEPHYFRLRHGYARLVKEDTSEILIEGYMKGHDGVCDWDDVTDWAYNLNTAIVQ